MGILIVLSSVLGTQMFLVDDGILLVLFANDASKREDKWIDVFASVDQFIYENDQVISLFYEESINKESIFWNFAASD